MFSCSTPHLSSLSCLCIPPNSGAGRRGVLTNRPCNCGVALVEKTDSQPEHKGPCYIEFQRTNIALVVGHFPPPFVFRRNLGLPTQGSIPQRSCLSPRMLCCWRRGSGGSAFLHSSLCPFLATILSFFFSCHPPLLVPNSAVNPSPPPSSPPLFGSNTTEKPVGPGF